MNRSIIKLLLLCDVLNTKNQQQQNIIYRLYEYLKSNMNLYICQIPIKKKHVEMTPSLTSSSKEMYIYSLLGFVDNDSKTT